MKKHTLTHWRFVNAFEDMVRDDNLQGIRIMLEMIGMERGPQINATARKIMDSKSKTEVDEIIIEVMRGIK